ncbi:MAG: hypothetical protein WCG48_02610 [Candidatus Berkelbacteria bacterium]
MVPFVAATTGVEAVNGPVKVGVRQQSAVVVATINHTDGLVICVSIPVEYLMTHSSEHSFRDDFCADNLNRFQLFISKGVDVFQLFPVLAMCDRVEKVTGKFAAKFHAVTRPKVIFVNTDDCSFPHEQIGTFVDDLDFVPNFHITSPLKHPNKLSRKNAGLLAIYL